MRGPGKSKQRIEALEDRLATLESMLRQESRKDLSDTRPRSSEALPDANGSFEPPSPRVVSAPNGRMVPFHQIPDSFTVRQREECTKALDRIAFSPLTAEASELWLMEKFLGDVCAELPFLRIPWFLDRIRRLDAVNVPDAWWQGLINAIIASAIPLKPRLDNSFYEMAVYSWGFFRNAYAVLPELIIHGDCLGAAQAVLAMAMFMRQSADTRTTAILSSIAIRMQHSAGLHVKARPESISSPVEDDNRSRLLWAAFILDMDMTVNTGLPPAHTDQGTMADLPMGEDRRDIIFRLRAELAGIQRRIGVQLIAPTETDLFVLESELEAWSLRVPLELRPDWRDRPENASSDQATDISVAMLHLVYYNSLSMICWASVRHGTTQMVHSSQVIDSIQERMAGHKSAARAAARASICAMSQFPFSTRSFADLWRALCYPLSATIVLLAVVCKEPAHPEAPDDLWLMAWFVEFLERMVRNEGFDLQKMRDGVSTFQKVATDAVSAALSSAMPVNPALWPLGLASGHTGKTIATLLTCSSHHPMYLAQSFMGNTPNPDTDNAKQLVGILGLPWGKNGYGPFVPDSMMPATYGFAFSSGSPR
ncbi:Activator of stress genes 1 [Madurella mycetomatis]|uniref:Activator of stress genes 1 n=1 Tax=Madurella mycetomatis TaxID=100816 RepID=A0A175WCT6_9PEZI|nr:Activator of stress genes 1 [Madurella mycetomatis]KXX81301.1 Activator of stress genes 1 [Madurella mycetomatis]